MAQKAEAATMVKATKKKALSAVYVNRFGKHSSGAVLRFGDRAVEERNPLASKRPSASSGGETERTGLRVGNRTKKSSFISPKLTIQKSPPAQVDTRKLLQNNENADVFKFPLPVKSVAEKQKPDMPAKKHEVFRVISKMLNENQKLRRRFLSNGHKNTKVTEEEEISAKENGSTGTFDATLFGWV
ncbi:uncharacterized protein LOC103187230 isoform X2 [Callorhinchus milii]|uniref:uncharacterized protein LOC103187230 isoform X2 n=1 Tax=Callorhinchus milii TaxID=7868 RepID=UPI001C3FAEB9|nr:uncharacterized protein LOC103187230 isoform X2 [Callorhinchus milii]